MGSLSYICNNEVNTRWTNSDLWNIHLVGEVDKYCILIKKGQPYGRRTSLVVEEDAEYPLQQLWHYLNRANRNVKKLSSFQKSSGRSFHKIAAVYLKEFLSYVVVLAFGTSTILEYLKLYLL
jgi:hypothetical protein